MCTLTQTCTCTIHTTPHTRTHWKQTLQCVFCLWGQAQIFLASRYYMYEATHVIYVYVHIYGPMLSPWRPRCGIHWVAGRALRTPSETWEQELHLSVWFLFTNSPLAEAGHMALSVTKNRGKTHLYTENWKYAQQGTVLWKYHTTLSRTQEGENWDHFM